MKSYKEIFRENQGFTLIEIIAVIVITGIILLPLLSFFLSNYQVFINETNKIDVQELARASMDQIITNLRRADQSSINVDMKNNILSFKIGGKTYSYYLSGKILLQKENNTSNHLAYNVKEFKLLKTDDLITISMIVEVNQRNGYTLQYENKYKIRN